jgi:hypothetical protein
MSDSNAIWSDTGAAGINSSMKNEYFYAEPKQSAFLGTSTPYVSLHSTGKLVDVWNDMYWTTADDTEETPAIYVQEKVLKYGTWATQLANVLTESSKAIAGGQTSFNGGQANTSTSHEIDTFLNLYAAENTGFNYNFPWLLKSGDNIRSITNEWAKTEGLAGMLGSMAGGSENKGADLFGTAIGIGMQAVTPGFGFEDTKQYTSTSEQQLPISFPLYNTLSLESAYRHFSFVNLFTFQNLKTRTSLMSFIPPKIYTVDSYAVGGIYMAAAIVSNFRVDSIGTTRAMSEWYGYGADNILMPEAYKVTITFTDLLSQSSNIFAGTMGGKKVQVTNASKALEESVIGRGANAAVGKVEGALGAVGNFFNPPPAPNTPVK